MTDRWRVAANLATLANGLLGVGAILYALAGNKLWAMLLIGCAIGFDGLDGMLSRRSPKPGNRFGRIADSVADGITFGLAPAFLIAVHTGNVATWAPWEPLAVALAAGYFAAAIARLTYFTVSAHELPHFLGVPTPESALALVVALLFHDTPAFQSVQPTGLFVGVAVLSVMMVVPVPYPKVRRGSPFRFVAAATGVLAGLALVPLQFRPPPGSALYLFADIASIGLLVGVASYYLLGPFLVPRDRPASG
ncbi:MAG: CDP-alcohol phosphatidyltransferase family protein [Thermoplasmata archaeon]|nr:CDP-alcohol phosphatidyltransferase family protein [Thermoplasmata archaeon]